MADLNTKTFIAITGNGLSIAEDLARRLLMCELDAGVEDPEQRPFAGVEAFLEETAAKRAALLEAALTIWRYGRQHELKKGKPLGSFEEWAAWCRDPLLALGCHDPVKRVSLIKQDDPHRLHIAAVFKAWTEHHGARRVKVSDLHDEVIKLFDPDGKGRQYVAPQVKQLAGTRHAGFVLVRLHSEAKWAVDKYALVPAGEVK
jgi:hypothetical protein